MDTQERQVIEGLFVKLGEVERQAGHRDAEAEAFIRSRIAAQPGSPYYMAQTVVVQEQALNAAQARIAELEQQLASRPAGGGSFLSGLFGGGRPAQPQSPFGMGRGMPQAPMGMPQAGRGGGGFLAGAAQTAMGVAGGVLLGNLIANAFSGNEANAAETGDDSGAMAEDDGGGFDDELL